MSLPDFYDPDISLQLPGLYLFFVKTVITFKVKSLVVLQIFVGRCLNLLDLRLQALEGATEADFCYLVDITQSQQEMVDTINDRIMEWLARSRGLYPHLKARVAFVGYRDHDMQPEQVWQCRCADVQIAFQTLIQGQKNDRTVIYLGSRRCA